MARPCISYKTLYHEALVDQAILRAMLRQQADHHEEQIALWQERVKELSDLITAVSRKES